MEQIGIVKWFDKEKGFGILANSTGEHFLHQSKFQNVPKNVESGNVYIFQSKINQKKNRSECTSIRSISFPQDIELVMQNFNNDQIITFERESVLNRRKTKTKFETTVTRAGLYTFMRAIKREDCVQAIVSYYVTYLDETVYLKLCNIIEKVEPHYQDALYNELPLMSTEIFAQISKTISPKLIIESWLSGNTKYFQPTLKDAHFIESALKNYIHLIKIKDLIKLKSSNQNSNIFLLALNNLKINFHELSLTDLRIFDDYQLKELINSEVKIREVVCEIIHSRMDLEIEQINLITESIDNISLLKNFLDLKNSVPKILDSGRREKINESIVTILRSKTEPSLHYNLWLQGIIDKVSTETICENFVSESESVQKDIILKLSDEILKDVLTAYSARTSWFETLDLIRKMRFENDFTNRITSIVEKDILKTETPKNLFELFAHGYIMLSKENVINFYTCFDQTSYYRIIQLFSSDELFMLNIYKKITDTNALKSNDFILKDALKYLGASFEKLDEYIFNTKSSADYFRLWRRGLVKKFPTEEIDTFLNTDSSHYKEIKFWINEGLTTNNQLVSYLLNRLKSASTVSDLSEFNKSFYTIKALIDLDIQNVNSILNLQNNTFSLILWYFGFNVNFDFYTITKKFVYFNPVDQASILKRIIHSIGNKKISLEISELENILTVDVDLYKLNKELNPATKLDVSAHFIISFIVKFYKERKLLTESDLLKLLVQDLYLIQPTHQEVKNAFTFHSYIEVCKGRSKPSIRLNSKNTIKLIRTEKYSYFQVKFDYSADLVSAIKKIPGRTYQNIEQFWTVPESYSKEVIEFGKQNNFVFYITGNSWLDNPQRIELKRDKIPDGIVYCEGRISNESDKKIGIPFWWCAGDKCYEPCQSQIVPDSTNDYKLRDLFKILNLNLDETDKNGNRITDGLYNRFIALINRFNRLLDHLYCHECKAFLFPTETSNFAAHNVIRFQCVNSTCQQKGKVVYLNHCLNFKCLNIIDSRQSAKCENGLYICNECACCCSHAMFTRRLNNLLENYAPIPNNLIQNVEYKNGHLERAIHFCYHCGDKTEEVGEEIFKCPNCEIEFNLKRFNFQRPHRQINPFNKKEN